MKKYLLLTIFFFLLSACINDSPNIIEGQINPGDEVGGMLFQPVEEMDWNISLSFLCDMDSGVGPITDNSFSCYAQPGGRIIFGNCSGVGSERPQDIEELWQDFELEVTFDDHKINLAPFGFQDFDPFQPGEQYFRIWNLMVENVTSGTHILKCVEKTVDGTDSTTYVFTVSDQPETFPILTSDISPGVQLHTSKDTNLNYAMYIPGEYGVNAEKKWPVVIYLHGLDRANASVKTLKNDPPLNALEHQDFFPFIVVAPKASGEHEIWATDEMIASVIALVDEIEDILSVDPNRIYLTGVSAGGNGVWEIGLHHPGHFAALAPVMGYYGWPFSVPENICDLVGVPVWAFHGDQDETTPLEAEQNIIDALEACGGDAQITIFPGVGHDLDLGNINSSDLYAWFLEHEKK